MAGITLISAFSEYPLNAAELPSDIPSGIQRQIRYSFNIQNPFEHALNDQVLWAYGPISKNASQTLLNVDASMQFKMEHDDLNQTIMQFRFDEIAPLASKQINIVADVLTYREPLKQLLDKKDIWIHPEKYIESGDEGIREVASQLRRETAQQTCLAIYEWVRKSLSYIGYVPDDLGASYAMKERKGDCTEYACLAAALARANNIPARVLGGYVVDKNSIVRPQEYHNWAEVYTDGSWRLVDAQKENYWASSSQYIAWHIFKEKQENAVGQANRYRIRGEIMVR